MADNDPKAKDNKSAGAHTLADHVLGTDLAHNHDGDADHDHDNFDSDLSPEQSPLWIADHVTLKGKAADDAPLPGETEAEIVGRVDDGAGVEAMVVAIGGTTDRPDDSTFHITWSLAGGRRAKESNDVLARETREMFDRPMPIRLQPARFPP